MSIVIFHIIIINIELYTLILFILLHSSFQQKKKQLLKIQLLLKKKLDTENFFSKLHQQDENQKILIHDIRKHLLSIAHLNNKGETKKIADYISQIIQSSDLLESVQVCDNTLLNNIVLRAKQQCKKDDISFRIDIRTGCIDFLSEFDITVLFGNLLDNALNAAKNTPDSFIELNVKPHNNHTIVITKINSSLKNSTSYCRKLFTTSKKNELIHGYGLKSIQRIVKQYKGKYHFYFNAKDNTFHTILLLKKI